MVREALAGEKVVRLKGGDPLIFGRAGEEIAALRRAGLAVEVVNGITAGLGAAAALGVGWTDRRVGAQGDAARHRPCRSRGSPGPGLGRDRRASPAHGVTLVIYMGVSHIDRIVGRLLATLPASLPAAIVQHASTARRAAPGVDAGAPGGQDVGDERLRQPGDPDRRQGAGRCRCVRCRAAAGPAGSGQRVSGRPQLIASSSTSNTSVAFGGITPPAPRAP